MHDGHDHPIYLNKYFYFKNKKLTCVLSLRSVSDKACKIQTNSGSFFIFSSILDFSVAVCDEASKVQ
jgi:hypothetical protein